MASLRRRTPDERLPRTKPVRGPALWSWAFSVTGVKARRSGF